MRKTYEASIEELERRSVIRQGSAPSEPPSVRPRYDEVVGRLSFFRTLVEDQSFADLTLPGTFFGRSELARVSFRSCDLSHSTMCWNNFIDVDFTDACLADCDLRASIFHGCRFANADLSRALLGRRQKIELSEEQLRQVEWCDDRPLGG